MNEEEKMPEEKLPDTGFQLPETGNRQQETVEPCALNPQPQTPQMEVHHHGHVHEKKKWKEYVFQFFMLFLAVFCGFLAEYQLEHLIENKRENKYIKSMVQDLKTDTAKLGRNIRTYERRLKGQDTLIKMFHLIDKGYNQTIFRTLNAFNGFPDFIYTDGTIQQLKNSGGFRLLRKHNAVDSIMAYDAIVKTALINEHQLGAEVTALKHHKQTFFDFLALDKKVLEGTTPQQMEEQKTNYLLSSDKITVSKYYNKIRDCTWLFRIVKSDMQRVKIKASALITFLQKEYNLENE
jgi:hypothetical protein